MSNNDETADRRPEEDLAGVNADGTVGVGTDGSLVSNVDRSEEDTVGVGTDGSLVSHPHEHIDDTRDTPR